MLAIHFLKKIISGGQKGADRAALDWAIARGIAHGGWCPAGRRAEDGVIESKYLLTETESSSYDVRTKWNVRDSDATLIVNLGELDGGSLKTLRIAERSRKPVRVLQIDRDPDAVTIESLKCWALAYPTLNIAGPRESKRPGIYSATLAALDRLFSSAIKGV